MAVFLRLGAVGKPLIHTAVPPSRKQPDALRIGILGAAKIAPPAVIWPASKREDVVIAAVAARDVARASKYAKAHGIPKVHSSYLDLVMDPAIDAIYNPLPNGLHARWTIEALKRGKHVLCEKVLAMPPHLLHCLQPLAS